jgi:hypothetical protein
MFFVFGLTLVYIEMNYNQTQATNPGISTLYDQHIVASTPDDQHIGCPVWLNNEYKYAWIVYQI